MALGAKESGLNKWVEEFLETNETLKALPGPVILGIVLVFIATLTSVASNTATAAIVTPVLLGLVRCFGQYCLRFYLSDFNLNVTLL